MGNLNFNVNENPEVSMDFEPMPKGRYRAELVESEVKPTKSGTGEYLKCTFQILEAGYETKKVFHNFNIENQSPKAKAIGRGQLSSLCKACGEKDLVVDSSDLHNIPILLDIKIKPATGEFPAGNEIYGFHPAIKKESAITKTKIEDDTLPF